jgi:hypothetical protein
MTWTTARGAGNAELRFAFFSSLGWPEHGPTSPYALPTQTGAPVAIWNAARGVFAVSWVELDAWDGGGRCLMAELNLRGEKVGSPVEISRAPGAARAACAVAWTGSAYGFVWQDERDTPGDGEIYFSLYGCPP